MRLINTNTLILEEFFSDDIPRYAILSHTWGRKDDEVLFTDMHEPELARQKTNYQKLVASCKMARELALDYIWIDTCCIDKSGYLESSEAIRSMFWWYEASDVCLVYLADVYSESDIPHARWFTRGWTLQELIAPRNINFYSSQWMLLGTKSNLSSLLSEITKIPKNLLSGELGLEQYSFDERMTWAAKRQTTRKEDLGYCLLGIFGINMPLLYGEGHNAFRRLVKEIDKQRVHNSLPERSVAAMRHNLRDTMTIALDVDVNTESIDVFNEYWFTRKLVREIQAVDQVTDSGYGGSSAIRSQTHGKELGASTSAVLPATTSELQVESTKDETRTQYSDTESLLDSRLLCYVSIFADELHESLPAGLDKARFGLLSQRLDELLRTFAFKTSRDGSTSEHRYLMYLVYRYRSEIIENLRARYDGGSGNPDGPRPSDHDDMTVEEKMSLWRGLHSDRDDREIPDDLFDNVPDEDINVDSNQLTTLEVYRQMLKRTTAYQWLVWRIMTEDRIECPGPYNAQKAIRDSIIKLSSLKKQFSRGKSPSISIEYHLGLNLSAFHIEQEYSCTVEQVLEQAITITGYENDVQGATCLQYVSQTWGETGVYLLRVLQQAVLDSVHPGSPYALVDQREHNSSGELSIVASYTRGKFVVSVIGIPYSVAEIGELLAWIAAALRSSPSKRKAASCRPVVSFVPRSNLQATEMSTDEIRPTWVCRIGVEFQTLYKSASDYSYGSCWLDSFRSPVIVEGYPILRRSRAGSGLEVPVDMMALLANANYLVDFCGQTVLKGFSTMLVATEIVGSTVFWHLFYNEDKSYISYSDVRIPRIQASEGSQTLHHAALATSRHILGWCEKVSCLAGMRNSSYDIGWSKLSRPHSAFAFENVSITAGKYLSVGTSMSIGIKDKPVHISYDDDYLSTLQMISERYFVFYDNPDCRPWLIDGASALLHLLRAFIRNSQTDSRLKDFFLFEDDELEETHVSKKGGDAAFHVLANEYNQLLPLWRKTTTTTEETTMKLGSRPEEALKYQKSYFCLKDRVSQICRVLQQMIAHQDDVHSRDGVGARIKLTPRRQLEGFDFMDVATNQGTLWPKVDYINAWGEGWVDLIRELHCVTLFGTGFGELIKPIGKPCQSCMSNIPQQPDLLAITATDLLSIVKKRGDDRKVPWRVVEDIHWYMPDKLFEPCRCDSVSATRFDRVQVFLPAKHPKLWGRSLQTPQVVADGAILVGHSFKYPLRWGGRKVPEEGEPEGSDEKRHASLHDSGIGSSSVPDIERDSPSGRRQYSAPSPSDRSNQAEASTSDSAIYLHDNQQFVHGWIPSQRDLGMNDEIAISASSVDVKKQDTDRRTRGKEKTITYETKAGPSRQPNNAGKRRPRPTGNFSSLWSSLGQ